jgi:hypothetical protein
MSTSLDREKLRPSRRCRLREPFQWYETTSTGTEQVKGSVKEAIGKLTGDARVEAEGRRQKRGTRGEVPDRALHLAAEIPGGARDPIRVDHCVSPLGDGCG